MVYDAAVVGAGVAGIATAYTLQRAGFRTVVLERRERPALETSFANGGIITPSMSEPWAAPGIPRLLWSSMGREEAPFLLRPGALPGMLRWGGRFLLNCTQARWQENCRRLMQLSLLSQRCLNTVARAEGLQHLLQNTGSLRLLPDDAALLKADHDMRRAGQREVTGQVLSRAECLALDPALANVATPWRGGICYPKDQSADCREFLIALLGRCPEIELRCDSPVLGVDGSRNGAATLRLKRETLQARYVVLCCAFPRNLGVKWAWRLPAVFPVKGYSLTFAGPGVAAIPRIALIDDARKTGIVHLGGHVRVVGTAEFCGYDLSLNEGRLSALRGVAERILPPLRDLNVMLKWAGLRPMTASGLPVLARVRNGVFAHLGHGHLGWTCAFGGAKRILDLIESS